MIGTAREAMAGHGLTGQGLAGHGLAGHGLAGQGRADIEAHAHNRGENQHRGERLTIALINNMPDAALQSTERHFCALLSAASGGMLVRLKFFSVPGIARAEATRAHIARYYEDFSDLQSNPPDGVIVTGTEPRSDKLRDEPYWPSLSWLVDWLEDAAIPSVWSCLAAHAAVLQMDGIERHAFRGKLSGLFECQISAHKHHIFHGLPNRWRVPHSRFYGLRESALLANGYSILSRSREVGPDIFLRQGRALQLFFQGHPEYRAATLLGEYRRDIARFLAGERTNFPAMPRRYIDTALASDFAVLADNLRRRRNPAALAQFDALAAKAAPPDCWSFEARRIYTNWLAHLDDNRARRPAHMPFARPATEPAHAAA